MERTFADIEADIASLRANAVKYRKLAEDRRAAGHFMVAEKLMELLAELEAKLGAFARCRSMGALPHGCGKQRRPGSGCALSIVLCGRSPKLGRAPWARLWVPPAPNCQVIDIVVSGASIWVPPRRITSNSRVRRASELSRWTWRHQPRLSAIMALSALSLQALALRP